jgi:hypothetical protein
MRGSRTWAWIVALTAGAAAVGGAAPPALADDPSPWAVTDHSQESISGASSTPAPAAAARRPSTTARAPVRPPPAKSTAKTAAKSTAKPATPKATPKAAPRTTPKAVPTRTPAVTASPAPGWIVQEQPPATAAATPSPRTASGATPAVALPAAASADGDVDVDLTGIVTGGDTTWNRASTGGPSADWTRTLAAIAAARSGRTGTTYLRVAAPLAGTGAQAVPPATFREAWRRWSEAARGTFPQARLVLTVDAGRDSPDSLAPFWPGDSAVDVVGVRARIADPGQAGAVESLTDPRGLAAWLGFAAARGKAVGVPDWGIESGADTPDGVTFTRWMQATLSTNAATTDEVAGRVAYAPLDSAPRTAASAKATSGTATSAALPVVSYRRHAARAAPSPTSPSAPPPRVRSTGS